MRFEVYVHLRERHAWRVPNVPREAYPPVRVRRVGEPVRDAERRSQVHEPIDRWRVTRLGRKLDAKVAERQLGSAHLGDRERAAWRGIRRRVEIDEARRIEPAHEDPIRVDTNASVDRAQVVVVDSRRVRELVLKESLPRADRDLEGRADVGVILGRHVDVQLRASDAYSTVHVEIDVRPFDGDHVERCVKRLARRLWQRNAEVLDAPAAHDEAHDGGRHLDFRNGELARKEREEPRPYRDTGGDEGRVLAVVRLDPQPVYLDGGRPQGEPHVVGRDDLLLLEQALGLRRGPGVHPLGPDHGPQQKRKAPEEREEETEELRDDRPPIPPSVGPARRREMAFGIGLHRVS